MSPSQRTTRHTSVSTVGITWGLRTLQEWKQVHLWKPHPEYVENYAQVVKELKEGDTHAMKQGREVTKGSLESGQSDDPVHKYKFGKKDRMSMDKSFKIVRTNEEVDM